MSQGYQNMTTRAFARQQGTALIISLIVLAIVTVLSLSAMRNTNLDTRIAVNHQHKQLSFQAAENAFAILTGEEPNVDVPGTTTDDPVLNDNFFSATGIEGQPDVAADLVMDFVRVSSPGEYKFSGFGLSIVTLIYDADATGKVATGGATTHNRMGVVLVRD